MLKGLISAVLLAIATLLAATTVQQGCEDFDEVGDAARLLPDARHAPTVVLNPQKVATLRARHADRCRCRAATSTTIACAIRNHMAVDLADAARRPAQGSDPMGATDSSIARGRASSRRPACRATAPCMAGDGTVAPKFMPPPDLLAQTTRERKDGYIYSYIRHGGIDHAVVRSTGHRRRGVGPDPLHPLTCRRAARDERTTAILKRHRGQAARQARTRGKRQIWLLCVAVGMISFAYLLFTQPLRAWGELRHQRAVLARHRAGRRCAGGGDPAHQRTLGRPDPAHRRIAVGVPALSAWASWCILLVAGIWTYLPWTRHVEPRQAPFLNVPFL